MVYFFWETKPTAFIRNTILDTPRGQKYVDTLRIPLQKHVHQYGV